MAWKNRAFREARGNAVTLPETLCSRARRRCLPRRVRRFVRPTLTRDPALLLVDWLDYTTFFAGGEEFDVGLPTIAFAPNITSEPETGIGDWSLDDILRVIREGTDPRGDGICPPMGGGPSGLAEDDALDIAHYIKPLPPVVGERAEMCPFPPM